jgi:ferredoxin
MVDRTAFDKIQQAGGYVSINTGGIPDANAIPIGKDIAEEAMDAAACIGCGACVAACKNGSAMLFVSAKVSQFALLPQGKVEAKKRVKAMVAKMDELGRKLDDLVTKNFEDDKERDKELARQRDKDDEHDAELGKLRKKDDEHEHLLKELSADVELLHHTSVPMWLKVIVFLNLILSVVAIGMTLMK